MIKIERLEKANHCLQCVFRTEYDECLLQDEIENEYAESWDDLYENCPVTEEVESIISYYDKQEIFENCTVEVLTNTKTGETSVGWRRNES